MTAEETELKAKFEALSDGARNKKIGIAINAASGAYTGFTVGGPIGAAVGGALGVLIGYWGLKSYRERAYAELEAMGLTGKRRIRRRSLFDRYVTGDPGFYRYPHGELVGNAVIEVLTNHYPRMSETEISRQAYAIVKTFHEFRRSNPDVPVEVAAEVILLLNGIRQNPETGRYERFDLEIPEEQPGTQEALPPDSRDTKRDIKIAWGLAAAAVFIMLFRANK